MQGFFYKVVSARCCENDLDSSWSWFWLDLILTVKKINVAFFGHLRLKIAGNFFKPCKNCAHPSPFNLGFPQDNLKTCGPKEKEAVGMIQSS